MINYAMIYDVAIVGCGVAALSAALSCVRSGLSVIIFGGNGATAQIDSIENYPGIFPAVSGSVFIDTLKNQVQHFAPKKEPELFTQSANITKVAKIPIAKNNSDISVSTNVKDNFIKTAPINNELTQNNLDNSKDVGTKQYTDKNIQSRINNTICIFSDKIITFIDKRASLFYLGTGDNNTIIARTAIIATGCHHKTLDIPGEKENIGRGVSYCAQCDAPYFSNKEVALIGGGDSALNEALYLSRIACSVTIIIRRNEFRAQQITIDRILSTHNIKVIYNTIIEKIDSYQNNSTPNKSALTLHLYNREEKRPSTLTVAGVFIFVGATANNTLVDMLPTDEAGFIITDDNMATIIPGLFVAGDVRSKPLRQLVTAASDGFVAANSATQYINTKR